MGIPRLYSLKSTGALPQTLIIPVSVPVSAMDNTLPPTLEAVEPIQGNPYHQDRRLIKRIISDVYTVKLKMPDNGWPLTDKAKLSWEKQIRAELERNLNNFKKDLREVCGSRKLTQMNHGYLYSTLDSVRSIRDRFEEDFLAACALWKKGGYGMDYSDWKTFLGIYGSYRKIIGD
jgi:hypothetical protein